MTSSEKGRPKPAAVLSDKRKQKLAKKGGSMVISLLRFILLAGISFVILYPLVTKILVSFMPVEDVYDMSVHYIPKTFTLSNYRQAWNFLNIPELALNSFLYPLVVSVVQTVSATVVAYGFARFDFRFKNIFFFIVVLGMIVPPDLILLPLYVNFRYFDIFGLFRLILGEPLNLLNTITPFVLLGITCTGLKNGLYIFMMRQYFRGLPKELEEAAYVDGAGTLKAFVSVFLASARQIMMTVFLFSFVWQWLDDIFTSVFLQDVPMLTTELYRLISNSSGVDAGISNLTEFSLMRNCGMLFLIIPMLVLYLFCQRYFTESIERSGLVG